MCHPDILPAILSPPHIQNAGYSTSGRTYTQSYLAAGEETLESFDVGMSQHHLLVFK